MTRTLPTTLEKSAERYYDGRIGNPRQGVLYPVQGDNGSYGVTLCDDGTMYCTCPAHGWCWHKGAAMLAREAAGTGERVRQICNDTERTTQ